MCFILVNFLHLRCLGDGKITYRNVNSLVNVLNGNNFARFLFHLKKQNKKKKKAINSFANLLCEHCHRS